jgi:hypothetical protein
MAESNSTSLGFLSVEPTEDEAGFIGALMVTDSNGYPLEFRATNAVRPTTVQRALYGTQLEQYVSVELCAKTLVKQMSRKPNVIIVSGALLLGVAPYTSTSLLFLNAAGRSLLGSGQPQTTIPSPSGSDLTYSGRFVGDSEAASVSLVEQCASNFDLLETFERIRSALRLLAQEDKRYA